jgi:hypothetical protein
VEATVGEPARPSAAVVAAFAAEYDGPHDPRDALHWLTRPGEPGPSGHAPPEAELGAARVLLYRPGVRQEDRDRLVAIAERIRADEQDARAALDRAVRKVAATAVRRRRRAARIAVAVGAAVVVAGLVAGLVRVAADAPSAAPGSARPVSLRLDRLPEPWRLSSLVTRSGGLDGAAVLRMNRSVTGASFLLVVACPAADRSFVVRRTEEDGSPIGGPLAGRCGARALVPLGLERGVGRVLVRVETRGAAPFAAAIVRRGTG